MSSGCEICKRLPLITPDSPYFLAELETGFAILGDHQIYDGYSLFIAKKCVPELHHLNRAANAALAPPLTLNYEFNDPADLEQLYFRSDHYSYAAKGVPVIFFTTGLHPDYHANTDEVSKIEFDKMARITRMIYETGARAANLDHAPARDNQGPRAGRLTQ